MRTEISEAGYGSNRSHFSLATFISKFMVNSLYNNIVDSPQNVKSLSAAPQCWGLELVFFYSIQYNLLFIQ